MGETAIEWTHRPGTNGRTWNPVKGCSRVSEGCRHCYAERQAARIVRMHNGKPSVYDDLVRTVNGEPSGSGEPTKHPRWTGKVVLDPKVLAEPLKWRDPSTVFVNSMSDLFHETLTNEQIAAVFGVMAASPKHTFIVLTKRARRMREWFAWVNMQSPDPASRCIGVAESSITDEVGKVGKLTSRVVGAFGHIPWPLPNVWLGVSVENQDAADERIPELLQTPAAVRLLSCEPLLGPVVLGEVALRGRFIECPDENRGDEVDPCAGCPAVPNDGRQGDYCGAIRCPRIDWVIAGCESGPGARPCDVAWLRSLRDQCAAAGVPYFLKQANAQELDREVSDGKGGYHAPVAAGPGSHRKASGVIGAPYLDGRQHLEFPR